jgi:transcriptional regulator
MYVPSSFAESDPDTLFGFIEEHGFATLISGSAAGPTVSHVPLLLDRLPGGDARLLGHVARANRHWELFDGAAAALAIFHGPHAYVSPAWYTSVASVPTWNYAVVHAHGRPRLLDADAAGVVLARLIEKYEGHRSERWIPQLPADYAAAQMRAIVAFEIPIERLEAKFKLGQNRPAADREGSLVGLEREPDHDSQALAAFARRYFAKGSGG